MFNQNQFLLSKMTCFYLCLSVSVVGHENWCIHEQLCCCQMASCFSHQQVHPNCQREPLSHPLVRLQSHAEQLQANHMAQNALQSNKNNMCLNYQRLSCGTQYCILWSKLILGNGYGIQQNPLLCIKFCLLFCLENNSWFTSDWRANQ